MNRVFNIRPVNSSDLSVQDMLSVHWHKIERRRGSNQKQRLVKSSFNEDYENKYRVHRLNFTDFFTKYFSLYVRGITKRSYFV